MITVTVWIGLMMLLVTKVQKVVVMVKLCLNCCYGIYKIHFTTLVMLNGSDNMRWIHVQIIY